MLIAGEAEIAGWREAEIAGDEVDVNVVNAPSSPNGIPYTKRPELRRQGTRAGQVEVPFSKDELKRIRQNVGRFDALLLRRDGKGVIHAGKLVDLFSRYAYPIAYAIAVGYLYSELPARPSREQPSA